MILRVGWGSRRGKGLTVGRIRRLPISKMAAVKECADVCFDVVAVLPAGGSGIRMNLELPKQVKDPQSLKTTEFATMVKLR